MSEDPTAQRLEQWHAGDEAALHALIDRDAAWVHEQVRRQLGEALRGKLESVDVVQDAMIEVLRYAPKFVAPDQERFRGLMVRVIENVIRDRHNFFHARRRAMSREASAGAALHLSAASHESPSRAMSRSDDEEWLRLGLELLSPEDREVVVLRQWDELEFAEIGAKLGVAENAARMRFRRALGRLARQVSALRRGTWIDPR